MVTFEVEGYVQPWQRTVYNYVTAPETRAYKLLVALKARSAMRSLPVFETFISLEIDIFCLVPKSWSKKKKALALEGKLLPTHCDIDNQLKGIQDALTKVVYQDDRLINRIVVNRMYASDDKAIITVRPIGV